MSVFTVRSSRTDEMILTTDSTTAQQIWIDDFSVWIGMIWPGLIASDVSVWIRAIHRSVLWRTRDFEGKVRSRFQNRNFSLFWRSISDFRASEPLYNVVKDVSRTSASSDLSRTRREKVKQTQSSNSSPGPKGATGSCKPRY